MKIITPEELATALGCLPHDDPRVVLSGNLATPGTLLSLFDANVESARLFVLNAHGSLPERRDLTYETPFLGPALRGRGDVDYLPARLSMVPSLFASSHEPDLVLLNTSVPRAGHVSLGIEVNILPAAIEAVRARGGLVVAQLNEAMPYIPGDGEIPLEWIDLAVEVVEPPLTLGARHIAPEVDAIASHVASLVPDGATLQIGIGAVPDVVLSLLSSRSRLKVWTETVSDGLLTLERAGALDQDHEVTAGFLLGSPELYEWAATSGRVRLRRTENTNDPSQIARQPAMTSINTALQVDLFAQSIASYRAGRIYSGFGGQSDFTVGAMHAEGGQAIIALPSWHAKTASSTIIGVATSPITSFQHSAVVTEHGIAPVFGRSQRAQARSLISQAADPRAHAELWAAAQQLGLSG